MLSKLQEIAKLIQSRKRNRRIAITIVLLRLVLEMNRRKYSCLRLGAFKILSSLITKMKLTKVAKQQTALKPNTTATVSNSLNFMTLDPSPERTDRTKTSY